MARPPVLLSKSLDPLLGVFTGVLAYYLHETNPRTAPAPSESLGALVQWKREKWAMQKLAAQHEEVDVNAGIAELLRSGEEDGHKA
ncbi:hypothetical protein M0805_001201 [Coniferiporia weirii]|nr:hypothetical protein M0805_001201 [Coniferiporia weirii]